VCVYTVRLRSHFGTSIINSVLASPLTSAHDGEQGQERHADHEGLEGLEEWDEGKVCDEGQEGHEVHEGREEEDYRQGHDQDPEMAYKHNHRPATTSPRFPGIARRADVVYTISL
jgi:hypothetical protein